MARRHDIRRVVCDFVANISGFQRRKNHHIGLPCSGLAGAFCAATSGTKAAQTATRHRLPTAARAHGRFLSLLDVGNAGVTGAAVTGKRQLATRGSSPVMARQVSALASAYPPVAPPSAVALRCNRQSPIGATVLWQHQENGGERFTAWRKPIMRNPARSTFAVEERLPRYRHPLSRR